MHYNAKRGLAIAFRLSVRLSVTLVDCDHIGWNSSTLISRLVSVGSLSVTQTSRIYSKGATENLGPKWPTPVNLSVGDIWSQNAAEWLQIAQWSQWRAYRKLPSLFQMVPSMTLLRPLLQPKWGSHMPPWYANAYLCNEWSDTLHVWFYGRVFRVGWSNGAISGYIKSKMASWRILNGRISAKRSCYPLYVKILW